WQRDERLLVVGACLVMATLITQIGSRYGFVEAAAPSAAAFACILITILLSMDLAIVAAGAIGVLAGITAPGADVRIILIAAAGGTVAAFAASYAARRASAAVRTAVIVAIANVAVPLVVNSAFEAPLLPQTVWTAAIGGIVASVLAVGAVWALERPLNITTDLRLAELSNPSTPILRRLMDEAPGTYHGSLTLANWCETIAAAVGANPLLARVGAYYHDIGKLEKPFYFIENQFGADNPHDRLEPALSARIVARHTKEGYRLARELRLPDKVCEMTRQHHGTSLIAYFYHKAREAADDGEVDEAQFRHYGPKPAFKEAGILMLADTVEAAARTLTDPNPSRIQALVDRLTQAKIDDGQLDDCDLTFKDIRTIKETLCRILVGVFHRRVPYPDEEDSQRPDAVRDADRSSKPTV
ncbi:MAG: HDIG domain-containing metalloprotein, partial [Armatimonadota bacterium]